MSLAYWQSCRKALPQCPPVSFESRHLPLWPTNKHVNAVRKVLGDSINLLLSIIGLWTCSENMRRSGANFTEAMPWTGLLSFWLQGRRPCTAVFCCFLILINRLPHLVSLVPLTWSQKLYSNTVVEKILCNSRMTYLLVIYSHFSHKMQNYFTNCVTSLYLS